MSGSDIYKTLLRHFQSWEDNKQIRITYPKNRGYTVRIVICTATQAAKLEKALIVKIKPKDNPVKYENYKLLLGDEKIVKSYYEAEVAPF